MDYLSRRLGADGLKEDRRVNSILDDALVGLVLLASAGYAAVSLGPRGLRRHILGVLNRAVGRAPAFLGLGRTAQRLAASMAKSGACGGCDNCGGEQAPAQKTPTQSSPAAEVRVPLGKIGRRTRSST
jgi:hypothetical protein